MVLFSNHSDRCSIRLIQSSLSKSEVVFFPATVVDILQLSSPQTVSLLIMLHLGGLPDVEFCVLFGK